MSRPVAPSFETFRPAPERLWIRYRPRRWPGAAGPWTDWARAGLGRRGRAGSEVPAAPRRSPDDVIYLPPVDPAHEPRRRELAAACSEAGSPVLLQRRAGADPEGAPEEAQVPPGIVQLWDLLPALLHPNRAETWHLPPRAGCVWPLIAGLTDGEERVEEGLDRLREIGAATVQAVALELPPRARRRLAEAGDERVFDRLFHAPPPSVRAFARRAAARGLGCFVDRPLPAGPPRLVLRRKCAGELRLAADLRYRLGRPEPESQKLLRAARWIDREDRDLAALAEDHNLEIVQWIDAASREVIQDLVTGERSRLVEALLAEYTDPAPERNAG